MKMLKRSRNALLSQWEELLRLRLVVLKNCEHEDIHDLRVASRRFRAALNLLGPLCAGNNVQKVTKIVRRLTRELGNLRNLDEALLFFGSCAGQTSLTSLLNQLADMRESERRKVIKALKGFRPGKLAPLVSGLAAGLKTKNIQKLGIPSLPSYLSNTSDGLFGNIQTLLPSALRPENSEERHALRIAFKKLRYFLEIVSRIMERDCEAILEQLKKYQTLLGSMNDMQVFALLCSESGAPAEDLAAAEQIIILENARLFGEFVALVKAAPLDYTFPESNRSIS